MYRINGVSMPGFGVALLLCFALSIFSKFSFQQNILLSIIVWIIVDIITAIQTISHKKH